MYPFFRSLLFRLDPEVAHQLTLQLMRLGGLEPIHFILHALFYAPAKPVNAFGLTFRNPVGLAAGYDKDAVALKGLTTLGFGHIEVGTVTPKPQPGNPRPRIFRLPEDEAVINRMGFPGNGAAFTAGNLKRLKLERLKRSNVVIGVNLGKNKDTPNEEAVLDYLELLQCFAPYAGYLAINISSPN
ncbi:MAG TPA: dihydroorotate dehydrogenase (quinone), partial [Anaerolineales bacterium]|nr:dihydroorotate dehydrogenase (quinone) [Anaerolineales bacterium]